MVIHAYTYLAITMCNFVVDTTLISNSIITKTQTAEIQTTYPTTVTPTNIAIPTTDYNHKGQLCWVIVSVIAIHLFIFNYTSGQIKGLKTPP